MFPTEPKLIILRIHFKAQPFKRNERFHNANENHTNEKLYNSNGKIYKTKWNYTIQIKNLQ